MEFINQFNKEETLTFAPNETVTISVENYEKLKAIADQTSLERLMLDQAKHFIKSKGYDYFINVNQTVSIVTKEEADKILNAGN